MDWALARGAHSIQSGQTGYAAKIEIGHSLIPLNNYCQHRSRIIHAIMGLFARRISWQTLDHDLASLIKANPAVPDQQRANAPG